MFNKTCLIGFNIVLLLVLSQSVYSMTLEECAGLRHKLEALEKRYTTAFSKSDYKGVLQLKNEKKALIKKRDECHSLKEEKNRKNKSKSLVRYRDGVLKEQIEMAGKNNSMEKLKLYNRLADDLEKQLELMLNETWYERNASVLSRVYLEVANRTLELTALATGNPTIGKINDINSLVQYGIAESRGMASTSDRLAVQSTVQSMASPTESDPTKSTLMALNGIA